MAGSEVYRTIQKPLEVDTIQDTDHGTLTTYSDLLGNTLRTVLDETQGGVRTVETTTFNGADIPIRTETVVHGDDLVTTTVIRDDTGAFVSGTRVVETQYVFSTVPVNEEGRAIGGRSIQPKNSLQDKDRKSAWQEMGYR
ncbi:MAG: hypothetical protein ACE5DX_04340 [Candidatus Dojkabacteria bacterium]